MVSRFQQNMIQFQVRLNFSVFLFITFLSLASVSPSEAASLASAEKDSTFDEMWKTLEEGKRGPTGGHLYWDEGLHFDNPDKNFRLKIGGHMAVDMGYLNSGGDVKEAFSDFDGFDPDFRRMKVTAFTTAFCLDFEIHQIINRLNMDQKCLKYL